MDLKRLQETWNHLGETDPLWAILANPDMRGNRWQLDEFFATGVTEIQSVLADLHSWGFDLQHGRALDFGCGVGRLTQALAPEFHHVTGIDIAPSMIELAAKYNRHGERCSYEINETDDLRRFSDNAFSFIYSNIALQHMRPRYIVRYVKEFLRVLAPGGVLVFQLPGHCRSPHIRLASNLPGALPLLYRILNRSRKVMETYGIPKQEVVQFCEQQHARVLHVRENGMAGPKWTSFQYYVTTPK